MLNEVEKGTARAEFVDALATRLQADQLGRATIDHMAASARTRARARALLSPSEYDAAVLEAHRWAGHPT
jgi:hypothetical protein